MKRSLSLCLAALMPLFAQTPQQPLLLDDVLKAVEQNYPPLLATFAERNLADADILQALGRFDLVLFAQADTDRFGYYPNERVNVGFDQPLSTFGASTYGGWRVGEGSFAPYAGALDTRSLGEWRGGFKLPLVKNREIDDRRGNLSKARINRRIADLTIDQQRLIVRQLAARRYWDWAAAGQRVRIAQDVLRIAQERDQALREASELGQIPAIEVTENRRQILQRQSQVVEAERGIQQAAIELSLFYRDSSGQPKMPSPAQLPPKLPMTETLTDPKLEEDLATALNLRPEIERLARQKDQARIDIQLAENDRKPAVDLAMGFTSEAGQGIVKRGPNELKASLRFELPFQRRAAEGKLVAGKAKLNQLEYRENFAKDQVTAEVKDAASAVRAAHNRALLLQDEVTVALDLADAERERFRLGDSNLFTVNLREQAAVDAELRQVSAVNDYLRALTVYEQTTARLLINP
jgi:outer membrane protein TolC